jgi:hypothetical protein
MIPPFHFPVSPVLPVVAPALSLEI